MFLDLTTLNHPVHILDIDKQISPSAFIPFCEFGGEMSAMGVEIDQFDVPVCNSFQAKVLNDQLCYEVDLNTFSDKNNIENELELGFNFLMDYNEDRQVTFDRSDGKVSIISSQFVNTSTTTEAHIYLNTMGIYLSLKKVDDIKSLLMFLFQSLYCWLEKANTISM